MSKIVFRPLVGGVCAYYDNETGVTHVDNRMPAMDQSNSIVHELFHKILGHGRASSLSVHTAREVAVERLTARHLIPLPRLMEVMVKYEHSWDRAAALGVHESIMWARIVGLEDDEQMFVDVCVRRCIGLKMHQH